VSELAELGTATVYEASGREGLIDADLHQLIPGSRAAGQARTVRCGQGDNLMVHAVMDRAQPGDVLVLTMPNPEPVALIGDLLMTQAKAKGVAALLVDAAVRESAVAMGMTGRQLLWEVELPLATRTILAGVRIAAVTTIGTATIAAAIGGGGLGVFIFRGLASVDAMLLLAGAVPAALIAVAADRGLEWVEHKLSPV